ncbi:extracellular solute-binding protein [Patescibacteria group bacterium]|nr:MAG: extracellular solute-binding protein [Patescibacteria group bacterium]
MPKFTKLLPLFLLTGFLILAGFGCKGITKEQAAAIRPVALEYWTVADDVDEMQKLIDQYRAARPYLTVNLRQLRGNELYPRLLEALSEDKGPDIVSVSNKWLRLFLPKLAPMPDSVKDATVIVTKNQLGGTDTVIKNITQSLPGAINIDREYVRAVKNDVVVNGHVYGLPLSFDTMALFYNKDMLDKAGIAEPPKTWEDLQKQVKKLTRFNKQTGKITQAGAALGNGNVDSFDDLLYLLYRQSDLDFTDANGQVRFNLVRAGQENSDVNPFKVVGFFTDFANPERDTYSWNKDMGGALEAFVSGKTAFMLGYNFQLDLIKARAPGLNVEVTPMLQLNPEAPANAASYFVQTVIGKSKRQNEAWGLLNYLAHSRATKDYLDRSGRPSALRAYIEAQKQDPKLAPFAAQVLAAENWYRGTDYPAAMTAISEMLDDWLKPALPDANPDEVKQNILNAAAAKVNQTL